MRKEKRSSIPSDEVKYEGGEVNAAHSRQPPNRGPCGNSWIAAKGQAKTGLDFFVHLSVKRKRRNTKPVK